MNNKMATNTYLSEQKQNHRYREQFDGARFEGRPGGWAKKVKELRSIIDRHKIDRERLRLV